jgi:hypothetical protein
MRACTATPTRPLLKWLAVAATTHPDDPAVLPEQLVDDRALA